MKKAGNSSQAGWALITEGVTAARVEAHRLAGLLAKVKMLVDSSDHKEHLYQMAGDMIISIPHQCEKVNRNLDRTSYALAKIGEAHLRDRLSISDRVMVDNGIVNSQPFTTQRRKSVQRVIRKYEARRNGKS